MTENLLFLVITLLNLGLVTLAHIRINALRKDLRTPVVKKFNQDFKRDFKKDFKGKPVEIPKAPENFGKNQRDDKSGRSGNQSLGQNRSRNGSQQNRPAPIRRPAAKAPDVFSNEAPAPQASSSIPPRPVSSDAMHASEGRRPLPPRFNGSPADSVPSAPAPVNFAISDDNSGDSDIGMEFDRSKMAHGRRNVVAKPIIEDDSEGNA